MKRSRTRLPGGSAVVSNKLYVLGGFNLTGARNVVDTIWEMDPARPAGARWLRVGRLWRASRSAPFRLLVVQ